MASRYPNSGALFKNERKAKENDPGMTGQAEIDGVEYWISGWSKDGKGKKFLSLSFKRKQPAAVKDTGNVAGLSDDVPWDDSVPF